MEQADIFNNKLKYIKPGPTAFREVYNIVGKHKSPFCINLRINNITESNSEICSEHLKEYYSNIYTEKLPTNPVADLVQRVGSHIENISQHIYSFNDEFNSLENEDTYHFTDIYNIKSIIANIKNKKSSGIDGISNFLIKKFPDTTLELLTVLFNNCLNNCYFPQAWKMAKILPIKKKDGSNRTEDFRPISLLSNIGKLLEHVIKSKLENEFLIDPISSHQFGFKRLHSTQHALMKFHDDVTVNLRKRYCTLAISLDIEKAFDYTSHKGILYKLVELGVDPFLVKLFKNFFTDRKFCVQIKDNLSSCGSVNSGVPQGSILAPYLFNIYLYDFPHIKDNSTAILYADDCMVYSHNESPLQALKNTASHLGAICNFYDRWGIKINAAKSKAICIRNASGKCADYVVPQSKCLLLRLNGIEIPIKDNLTYLGVNFNKLFKFNCHGRTLLTKAKRITAMFSRLLNSVYLPKETKLLLYKVAIRSVLTYAFPVWFTISPTVAKELELLERNILRKCINFNFKNRTERFPNSFIYENASITPFCKYSLDIQRKFVERLSEHENNLMNEIYETQKDIHWHSRYYLSPIGILNEEITLDDAAYVLPDFFRKSVPGTHRG